jgi:ribosomal-protein-alanine N-acetyltransferase
MSIETRNMKLIPCDTVVLKAAIEGNDVFAKTINASIPDNWTEFGTDALQYSLDRLSEYPEEEGWWTYFPIHKHDNMLVGSGGFKGKPTSDGVVEIGYEIAPEFRNRGLATEMAMALVEKAFRDARVKSIIAHTLGQENPSTKVLMKCGFVKTEAFDDPDHGAIWKWEMKRG